MSDTVDQLCDDLRARAEALAAAVKQHTLTPAQRDKLRRDLQRVLLQIRHVLQTGTVQ